MGLLELLELYLDDGLENAGYLLVMMGKRLHIHHSGFLDTELIEPVELY